MERTDSGVHMVRETLYLAEAAQRSPWMALDVPAHQFGALDQRIEIA